MPRRGWPAKPGARFERLAGSYGGSAIRKRPDLYIARLRRSAAEDRTPRRWVTTLENAPDNADCPDMSELSISGEMYDAVVVGGGPAGLAAAIALSQAGARTAVIARRVPYGDNRTTALLGGSVDFLKSLEVWNRCEDQ